MKTLTLLRHAKSGWDDTVPRDFDRPLNAKGRRAATAMGRHLKSLGVTFDHVVASPAVRVKETLAAVGQGYGPLDATFDTRIYLASAVTLLEVIRQLPADAERVLFVGHNPGLEDLVLLLGTDDGGALRRAAEEKYPTATVAELTVGETWDGVREGAARLDRFVRPRDIDPSLGPDEE